MYIDFMKYIFFMQLVVLNMSKDKSANLKVQNNTYVFYILSPDIKNSSKLDSEIKLCTLYWLLSFSINMKV